MVKCPNCGEKWSRTRDKVCPNCGATPAGVMPAAPGSAFDVVPKPPPAPAPAEGE